MHSVSDEHLDIKDCKLTTQQMKCLKDVFIRQISFTKLVLCRKVFSAKNDIYKRLDDHFVKFDTIMKDLQRLGSKTCEGDRVCHLLLSLQSQYYTVDIAIDTVLQVKNGFC